MIAHDTSERRCEVPVVDAVEADMEVGVTDGQVCGAVGAAGQGVLLAGESMHLRN